MEGEASAAVYKMTPEQAECHINFLMTKISDFVKTRGDCIRKCGRFPNFQNTLLYTSAALFSRHITGIFELKEAYPIARDLKNRDLRKIYIFQLIYIDALWFGKLLDEQTVPYTCEEFMERVHECINKNYGGPIPKLDLINSVLRITGVLLMVKRTDFIFNLHLECSKMLNNEYKAEGADKLAIYNEEMKDFDCQLQMITRVLNVVLKQNEPKQPPPKTPSLNAEIIDVDLWFENQQKKMQNKNAAPDAVTQTTPSLDGSHPWVGAGYNIPCVVKATIPPTSMEIDNPSTSKKNDKTETNPKPSTSHKADPKTTRN